jgi:hypothetical protein
MADGCYEYFERADGDTRTTKCPACRAKERSGNRSTLTRQQGQSEVTRFASQEERQLAQAVLTMTPPRGHRLQSESINIDFGRGTMNIDRKFEPEPTVRSTGLGLISGWFGGKAT